MTEVQNDEYFHNGIVLCLFLFMKSSTTGFETGNVVAFALRATNKFYIAHTYTKMILKFSFAFRSVCSTILMKGIKNIW